MPKLIVEEDYQVRMDPSRIIHLTAHNGEKHEFRDGDNFTRLSTSTMRYRGKHVYMSRELIDHLVSNSKKEM
jgi:hypothetical protein